MRAWLRTVRGAAALHRRRWTARRQWRRWLSTPDAVFTVATTSALLDWVVVALNRLGPARVVFIDVGAARGDVLHALTRASGLTPPVFSIGIDPVDCRAERDYSAFVATAISNGAEGPASFFLQESSDCSSLKKIIPGHIVYDRSHIDGIRYFANEPIDRILETLVVPCCRLSTIIRRFDLANEVVHFLKIDAQGSDLDVFLSLDEFTRNCLFVQIETVYSGTPHDVERCLYEGQSTFVEDRAALEAAGFRLLGVWPFGVTPEADLLFVNTALFGRLFPNGL